MFFCKGPDGGGGGGFSSDYNTSTLLELFCALSGLFDVFLVKAPTVAAVVAVFFRL
jgi:hypothetical protein